MTQRATTERRGRFFSDIVSELKKVIWLARGELVRLTILVLVVAIVAGLILGALDFGFARAVAFILGK